MRRVAMIMALTVLTIAALADEAAAHRLVEPRIGADR